jgi:hypothetical protein
MTIRQKYDSGTISREKILLAIIPVIGSIIIAFFATNKFSCDSDHSDEKRISQLKAKAGKANEMIVYRRYNDLSEIMADGLKPIITKEVFNKVADTISLTLGDFLKPIDTTYTKTFGNDNFFIKNQYQKGTNINQIIFDSNGKIFGIFTKKYPD